MLKKKLKKCWKSPIFNSIIQLLKSSKNSCFFILWCIYRVFIRIRGPNLLISGFLHICLCIWDYNFQYAPCRRKQNLSVWPNFYKPVKTAVCSYSGVYTESLLGLEGLICWYLAFSIFVYVYETRTSDMLHIGENKTFHYDPTSKKQWKRLFLQIVVYIQSLY